MPCHECQKLQQAFFSIQSAHWDLEARNGTNPERFTESEERLRQARQALIEHQTVHLENPVATQLSGTTRVW